MNAAWLRGAVAYLDWILGDTPVSPLSGQHMPLDPVATLAHPEPPYAQADLISMRGAGWGAYHPCPGELRCSCEAVGYCLRGQCAACVDRTCNAARPIIEAN